MDREKPLTEGHVRSSNKPLQATNVKPNRAPPAPGIKLPLCCQVLLEENQKLKKYILELCRENTFLLGLTCNGEAINCKRKRINHDKVD